MNFCVDFGAEDAGRLTPFKDDKPKDTENSPFEASSVLVVKATHQRQLVMQKVYFVFLWVYSIVTSSFLMLLKKRFGVIF